MTDNVNKTLPRVPPEFKAAALRGFLWATVDCGECKTELMSTSLDLLRELGEWPEKKHDR